LRVKGGEGGEGVKGVELIGRREAVWLSERNFVQLIERSLLTEEPWVLVYGISNNPRRFWTSSTPSASSAMHPRTPRSR
jgi:hypothetical protein